MEGNLNKKLTGITAAAAAIAILLTGSYAWKDFTQVKANAASGSGQINEVRLVEDYDEIKDWSMSDALKTKRIYVKNTGSEKNQDAIVRLKIGEYMDLIEIKESPEKLLLDENGTFVSFESKESAEQTYKNHEVRQYREYGQDQAKYYIVTKAEDENGQFGKKMLLHSDEKILVGGNGLERPQADGQNHPQEECDKFHLYTWNEGNHVREYIEFQDGTVALDQYHDDTDEKGQWIIDTKDGVNTGWVYWSKPLAHGQETTDFISNMELKKQPTGEFFYSSDVHMETLTWDELNQETWTDMSDQIKDILSNGKDGYLENITMDTSIGAEFTADGEEWLVIGKDENTKSLLIMTKFTQGQITYNDSPINTYSGSNLEKNMNEFTGKLNHLNKRIQKVELKDNEVSRVSDSGVPVAFALNSHEFVKYLRNSNEFQKEHPLNPNKCNFIYGYTMGESGYQDKLYWLRGSSNGDLSKDKDIVTRATSEGVSYDSYNSKQVEYRPALWISAKAENPQ